MTDIDNIDIINSMEALLGKWKLKENISFTDFLHFTQLPWYQIQIANYSPIDLHLIKLGNMKYSKKVESVFYNVLHTIHINNEFKQCKDGKKVKYQIIDNKIVTDIIGTIVNWQEIISFEDPYLQIEYKWNEDGESKRASQIFETAK
jgi:hypothetical protein